MALTVALGSLTYGYDIGILGNVVNNPTFFAAMKLDPVGPGAAHATTIIAWWNCILYVAGFVFCLVAPVFGDRFGRKTTITVGAVFSIIGGALQAGSVNAEMLIGARLIIGIGMGFLLPGVPLYQAEIAPPASRGLIVGFHASFIGFGTMVASWIGVAFYHVEGQAGWRAPLALQLIFPVSLLICLFFVPESPRWLCMHDRHEEAARSIEKLHSSTKDPEHTFAHKELAIIKAQLAHEAQHRMTIGQALKKRSMQKRFALGFLAMSATQASGLIVVLTYQAVIFGALGYSGFVVTIFSGVWTFFNGAGNLLGGIIGDYVGRKKQMGQSICVEPLYKGDANLAAAVGLVVLDILLTVLCVTTKLYTGTDNRSGKVAAAVFTFLLICA
jgi:MFS family permease